MLMSRPSGLAKPEPLTALGIILAAVGFLFPTLEMRPISALLPADQRRAAAEEDPIVPTGSPVRAIGAFLLIVGYALATDFVGF